MKRFLGLLFLLLTTVLLVSCQYIDFNDKDIKVTYDLGYDVANQIKTEQYNFGYKLTKPVAPIRTNYNFNYWYEEGLNDPFTFNTSLTKDLTLIANWTKLEENEKEATYIVDLLGEGLSINYTGKIKENSEVILSINVPQNKVVNTLLVNDINVFNEIVNNTYKFIITSNTNIVITYKKAIIEQTSYDVTFNIDETNPYKVITVTEGLLVNEPVAPTKAGYEFVGWYMTNQLINKFDFKTKINSSLTIHAKWLLIEEDTYYTITFYNNSSVYDEQVVKEGLQLTKPTVPIKTGFEFLYWEVNDAKFDFTTNITSDFSLYAKYKEIKPEDPITNEGIVIKEDGLYTSKETVALYIATYNKLPSNYITKSQVSPHISIHWNATNKLSVGGNSFGNREGRLPSKQGRTFIELDIDYKGQSNRGQKRIVYSNDFRIFYTSDHYGSFIEYDITTKAFNEDIVFD